MLRVTLARRPRLRALGAMRSVACVPHARIARSQASPGARARAQWPLVSLRRGGSCGTRSVAPSSESAKTSEPRASRERNGTRASTADVTFVPGAKKRPVVAVDVDEVLAQFLLSLNNFYEETYGERYDIEHYDEYYFCKVWGCSPDTSNDIVHKFFQSHHFRDGIAPLPGAMGSLTRLKQRCDLVVVTSRQNAIQDATVSWLDTHYPGVFEQLHFCNHFALDGTSVKKSQVCKQIRADVIIDDNPSYALECAQQGLRALLFDWQDKYPWSKDQGAIGHEAITRVGDWAAVEREVEAMFFSGPGQQEEGPQVTLPEI